MVRTTRRLLRTYPRRMKPISINEGGRFFALFFGPLDHSGIFGDPWLFRIYISFPFLGRWRTWSFVRSWWRRAH